MDHTLHGACACGRNRYVVAIPRDATQSVQVLFDNSSLSRQVHASPFAAWLRVPLDFYRSATFSQFPDETHLSIRRSFVTPSPAAATTTTRQFCGYCGTQLTKWSERTREEADFISLTLGSLLDEDLGTLEDLGLLPSSSSEEEGEVWEEEAYNHRRRSGAGGNAIVRQQYNRGAPWFEALVEDSRFGTLRRKAGAHTSRDGHVSVEWEIVEWTDGGEGPAEGAGGKRKIDDIAGGRGDLEMR